MFLASGIKICLPNARLCCGLVGAWQGQGYNPQPWLLTLLMPQSGNWGRKLGGKFGEGRVRQGECGAGGRAAGLGPGWGRPRSKFLPSHAQPSAPVSSAVKWLESELLLRNDLFSGTPDKMQSRPGTTGQPLEGVV